MVKEPEANDQVSGRFALERVGERGLRVSAQKRARDIDPRETQS